MKALVQIAKVQGVEIIVVEGGNHAKVRIGAKQTVVPRHGEINEVTARSIVGHMGGKA